MTEVLTVLMFTLLTFFIVKLVKEAQKQRNAEIEDAMRTILDSNLELDFGCLFVCPDDRLLEIADLIRKGKL